jgi:anti-sigma factor RsiW
MEQHLHVGDVVPVATAIAPDRSMTERAEHLSAEELAAYIDHQLSPDETRRADAHLADCATCRRELAASSRVVATAPIAGSRRSPGRVAAVAAAAAILVAVVVLRPPPQRPDVAVERADGIEASRVQTVFPLTGSTVDANDLTFAWRRDDNASYQLRVVDSSGAAVWATTTVDTTARLPRTVSLKAGRYFLYVDALRADGFSVSSGPVEFTAAPR